MSEGKTTRCVPSRTKAGPIPGPGTRPLSQMRASWETLAAANHLTDPYAGEGLVVPDGGQDGGGTAPQPVYQAAGSDSGGAARSSSASSPVS